MFKRLNNIKEHSKHSNNVQNKQYLRILSTDLYNRIRYKDNNAKFVLRRF